MTDDLPILDPESALMQAIRGPVRSMARTWDAVVQVLEAAVAARAALPRWRQEGEQVRQANEAERTAHANAMAAARLEDERVKAERETTQIALAQAIDGQRAVLAEWQEKADAAERQYRESSARASKALALEAGLKK